MQKATVPVGVTGDGGRHYVLLLDSVFNTVNAVAATAVNGRYAFNFPTVGAGDYILIAGSDMNNDNIICDPGEACGAWPTLDQPATLTVNASRANLDFSTSFDATITGATTTRSKGGNRALPGPLRRTPRPVTRSLQQ
jgi:serine protease